MDRENGVRLLHVVSTGRRRGAEVFAADLVRLLAAQGVEQCVAVLWGDTPFDDVAYEAPVVALSPATSTGRTGWARGWLERVTALRRLIREWSPDVVQAHGGDALEHVVLAGLELPWPRPGRVPLVYRNIGLAAPWATRGLRRLGYSALMRRADMVIAVADAVARESVTTFRLPPGRVVTMPNGVDPVRLQPQRGRQEVRAGLGIPETAPTAVSVGALSWEKDPMSQLDVAVQVLDGRPDAFFLLAGDGPLRGEVESRVHGTGLGGRVMVLGSRDDVADLLGAADALLFASRSGGMEGMPAVLIEAGVAGLPVAAYDVAGVAEVVVNGQTGLLAPPGDVAALRAALGQLLDGGAADRREMGRRAQERCLARFDLRAQVRQYLDVYREVSAAPARR